MKFITLYKRILTEGRVPSIFRKATPEEIAERRDRWKKIKVDEWLEFFRKSDNVTYIKNLDAYDVDGSVYLTETDLTVLPVKFNIVNGNFGVSDNMLTSTHGFPRIVKGGFNCNSNKLTSLVGGPERVEKLYCDSNLIKDFSGFPRGPMKILSCTQNLFGSMEGCPIVTDSIRCGFNERLTSLEGCPRVLKGTFNCMACALTSLAGCPVEVMNFNCDCNKELSTVEGGPKIVHNDFSCQFCKSTYETFDVDSFAAYPALTREHVKEHCQVGGWIST